MTLSVLILFANKHQGYNNNNYCYLLATLVVLELFPKIITVTLVSCEVDVVLPLTVLLKTTAKKCI